MAERGTGSQHHTTAQGNDAGWSSGKKTLILMKPASLDCGYVGSRFKARGRGICERVDGLLFLCQRQGRAHSILALRHTLHRKEEWAERNQR